MKYLLVQPKFAVGFALHANRKQQLKLLWNKIKWYKPEHTAIIAFIHVITSDKIRSEKKQDRTAGFWQWKIQILNQQYPTSYFKNRKGKKPFFE